MSSSRLPLRTPARLRVWGLIGRLMALLAFAGVCAGFVALGNWQLERRAWKHDLIARIDARIHAPPVAAPLAHEWPAVETSPKNFEYRRVFVRGVFLHEHTTLVQATTVLGAGFWVLTPLQTAQGETVFINRGFVPQAQQAGRWRMDNPNTDGSNEIVTAVGLLRLSEPEGTLLRKNDPQTNRWYSRDVAQMAAKHGLHAVAPWFIDAQTDIPFPATWTLHPPAQLPEDQLPVAGLTVLRFNDNHLIYALTWYGLALMTAAAAVLVIRTGKSRPGNLKNSVNIDTISS